MTRAWLFKSEPGEFAFDDLWSAKGRRTSWDGIRNYQARNLLRDQAKKGDPVLFYHSSADPTGVVGLAEVARPAYPDPTQFDPRDERYDAGSTREEPRWWSVEIRAVRRLERVVELDELKRARELAKMMVVQRGSRLSIQPVTAEELATVLRLAAEPAAPGERPAKPPAKRAR
jgi:predicted RNA-binding protein with PUA-like domain